MKPDPIFGLFALIPASFNPAPASPPIWLKLCSGSGPGHYAALQLPLGGLPGGEPCVCCAKGCERPSRRRQGLAEDEVPIDPEQ